MLWKEAFSSQTAFHATALAYIRRCFLFPFENRRAPDRSERGALERGPPSPYALVAWVSGVSGGKGEKWKRKRERAELDKRLTQMLLLEPSTPTQHDSIPSNQNHIRSLGCQLHLSKSSPNKVNLTLRSGRAPVLVLLRFRFFWNLQWGVFEYLKWKTYRFWGIITCFRNCANVRCPENCKLLLFTELQQRRSLIIKFQRVWQLNSWCRSGRKSSEGKSKVKLKPWCCRLFSIHGYLALILFTLTIPF